MTTRSRLISAPAFTRPENTTAYADKDLVANNTSAGSVVPLVFPNVVRQAGYKAKIRRASLLVGGTAITNGTFRLHLFTEEPTVGAGDNSALAVSTKVASYIGYLEIVLTLPGAAGTKGWSAAAGPALEFISTNSKNLWGLLEAKAAYVPASAESITASIEVENS